MIIKMNHTNYTHYHEMLQKDADIKYPFRDKERDLYCKGGSYHILKVFGSDIYGQEKFLGAIVIAEGCTDFLHLNAFGREI